MLQVAAPRNSLLGYAQVTSTQTGIGTSATDITGLSVTFTAGSRPVWVHASLPLVRCVSAGGLVSVFLSNSSNQIIAGWSLTMAASDFSAAHIHRRLTILTAGTQYTFKLRAVAPTSATVEIWNGADAIATTNGGPSSLFVCEEI